ncbi:hypothetical protein K450DRAFT_243456 [Umbelopsis ramanniana AG]|uniref:Uncharacterized protein n=1 Tax=Umbelopsis ramanniana AG TaxID=1314678 RepID=A0AAD5HE68_UMBRA|nr:uncharacterized protein K450DRAFT_243456 [Umbelopsis ramanniana AG]KAI8579241.1 hypothetical protein K450DRAFT_243456 [Umbelopsis ramanniana AG]
MVSGVFFFPLIPERFHSPIRRQNDSTADSKSPNCIYLLSNWRLREYFLFLFTPKCSIINITPAGHTMKLVEILSLMTRNSLSIFQNLFPLFTTARCTISMTKTLPLPGWQPLLLLALCLLKMKTATMWLLKQVVLPYPSAETRTPASHIRVV